MDVLRRKAETYMYTCGFSAQDAAGLLEEPVERVEAWYQKWDLEH